MGKVFTNRIWSKLIKPTKVLSLVGVFGLFVIIVSYVPSASATAGINQQINFQARLLNAQGATVPDGNYNIQFKVYQDGDGVLGGGDETLKWTETRLNNNTQGVVVKNGYFSVMLGSVNAFGSSVDWDQDTLWLSLHIGGVAPTCTPFATCAGSETEMSPFKRLAANPYALNSQRLGGLDKTGFIQNTTSQQTASNFNISGTGVAGTALQAPIIDTASNIALGIGSTNATAINLQQSTTVAAAKTFTVSSGLTSLTGATTGDALNVSNSTSTGSIAIFKDNSTAVVTIGDGGSMAINPLITSGVGVNVDLGDSGANGLLVDVQSNTTSQYALRVTSGDGTINGLNVRADGNVGIGTTSPGYRLEVAGDIKTSGSLIEKTVTFTPTTIGWYRIVASGSAMAGGTIRIHAPLYDNTLTDVEFQYSSSGYTLPGSIQQTRFSGYNNGVVSQVRISSDGTNSVYLDVYVSTATAPQPVTVYGFGPNQPAFVSSPVVGAVAGSGSVNTLTLGQGFRSTQGANLAETGGNVGIGTATPAAKLQVIGSSNFAGDIGSAGLSGLQSQANNFNLAPNSSFEVKTTSTGTYPDGWIGADAAGNGTAVTTHATDSQSDGRYAIKSATTGTTSFSYFQMTSYIPVKPSNSYLSLIDVRNDATANNCSVGLISRVQWYTSAFAAASTAYTDVYNYGATTTSWATYGGSVTAPADAAFAQLIYYNFVNTGNCTRWYDNSIFRLVGYSGAINLGLGDGNIGLGTSSSSSAKVVIQGTTSDNTAAALNVVNSSSTSLLYVRNDGNVGIGTNSPAALLSVGTGSASNFKVNADGDVTSSFTALNGSSTTNGGSLGAQTNMTLTSAANFDVGNYIRLDNNGANCTTGVTICYAKITAKATNTLTITPALTWSTGRAVTEWHVPEIGGVNTSQTLTNRYGRGYFIGGVVTGNGSTEYNDGAVVSNAASFDLLNTDVTTLNIGGAATVLSLGNAGGTVTIPGALTVTGALTAPGPASGASGHFTRSGSSLSPTVGGDAITTTGNISTTGSGAITSAGAFSGPTTTNTINGLIVNAGALSGISTINASGAITAATATNTINGAIINAGALSGITTLNLSGAISGATATNTINNLVINNGSLTNVGTNITGAGAVTLASGASSALNLTGAAPSTWDIGNNLLSLQTTGNGAITTGTGLLTQGGNVTFSGTAARTITGPSTGGMTVTVGSGPLTLSTTTSGAMAFNSAGTLAAASTNFNLSTAGVVTVAGAQTADITTATAAGANGITVQPGISSAAIGTGAALNLKGGDESGTTTATGGAVNLTGGAATGASGTRNGGSVNINAGNGATADGSINIGTSDAAAITLGNTTNNTTFTLQGAGLTSLGGNLTFTGTAARTITGPGTGGLTMTVAAGPLTLSTTGSGTLAATSAGALNLTGSAPSTWDIGNNLLSLQTTGNGAITTGTGILTVGGNQTFSGTAARTITGPATGGLTVNVTSGPLTVRTTTSGTLAVTSAGALNLTGAAPSAWDIGANTLSIQTTGNGAITTGTGLVTTGGDLAVNGGSITTSSVGTANLFNANATTLNIGGAATTLTVGATTGTLNLRNPTISTPSTSLTLFNTNATSISFGGAATTLNIGNSAGTVTLAGDLAVNGADITTSSTGTATLFNASATVLNMGGAAASINVGAVAATTLLKVATTASATLTNANLLVERSEVSTTLRIGTGTNGVEFSAAGAPIYRGTARPSKVIELSPEYAGAALSADGSVTTLGTLVGDNAGSGNGWRNYYQWSSTQAALQDYTVMVRVTLPADFDSWETGSCPGSTCALEIAYQTGVAGTTNNAVSVLVNNTVDTPGTAVCTIAAASSTSWTSFGCTEAVLNDASAPEWDAAEETAVIRVKLAANSTASALARVGDITLRYKSKF